VQNAHGVAHQTGDRGGVDALAADVTDHDAPPVGVDPERVVEVAADQARLTRRPVAGGDVSAWRRHQHLREQAELQCLRDVALLVVQPGVVVGQCECFLTTLVEAPRQPRGADREHHAGDADDPPQVGEQPAAELADRCHHEQQLLIAEVRRRALTTADDRQVADCKARADQVVRLLLVEVDRIVELRKRFVGPAGCVRFGIQLSLGIDEVLRLVHVINRGVAQTASLAQQVDHDEFVRRRGRRDRGHRRLTLRRQVDWFTERGDRLTVTDPVQNR